MSEFKKFGQQLRELLGGLLQAGEVPQADALEERNKAVARRFFDEVFNQGKLAIVDEIFSPDYVGYSSANPGGPINGTEGIKKFVETYRVAFPDIHFEFDDVITKGDQVVVRWTTTGTHEGNLFGISPTGKRMTVTGIGIARIVDGKIGAAAAPGSFSQIDMLGMLKQLGVASELGLGGV